MDLPLIAPDNSDPDRTVKLIRKLVKDARGLQDQCPDKVRKKLNKQYAEIEQLTSMPGLVDQIINNPQMARVVCDNVVFHNTSTTDEEREKADTRFASLAHRIAQKRE